MTTLLTSMLDEMSYSPGKYRLPMLTPFRLENLTQTNFHKKFLRKYTIKKQFTQMVHREF